jgi:hypothetical protein
MRLVQAADAQEAAMAATRREKARAAASAR